MHKLIMCEVGGLGLGALLYEKYVYLNSRTQLSMGDEKRELVPAPAPVLHMHAHCRGWQVQSGAWF